MNKNLNAVFVSMCVLLFAQQESNAQNVTMFTGSSSSQTPYVTPAAPGVKTTAILTVGDAVGNYKMAGLPDGTGAYDNGDETFTMLVNHEMGSNVGAVHAHGATGAFVSKWVIRKSDLSVVSGSDLISKVNLWNGTGYDLFNPADTTKRKAFARFCSADLPSISAFYNATTGMGTQSRIFLNGEESGSEGRGFAHVATGPEAGITYELPYLGKYSYENAVASPNANNKTIVVGLDDATPGQVYVYVGNKSDTGNEIQKAGLSGGKLYGIAVAGLLTEVNTGVPAVNTPFTLADLGNVANVSGAALNTKSDSASVTKFLRPEDGAWDPKSPNDFYFVTTNGFSANSRLWKASFTNIATPELGGTITAVLEGSEGPKMMDNIGFDNHGRLFIQEDVGNNAHIGKTWEYHVKTDMLKLVAAHDTSRFLTGASGFLTQDEEASGIIDAEEILGPGMFLFVDQAHYPLPGELVEGGQILAMYAPRESTGPSTAHTPYVIPEGAGVTIKSILTVGDSIGNYKMAGLPDGTGAYDNGDGTFTMLVNHEMGSNVGAVHAHGATGAFVSKWVMRKSDLAVLSGSDLISKVNLWNGTGYDLFNPADTTKRKAFARFCSADLPSASAFYNATTGMGTQSRIFLNGEESGSEGRGFAHVATGPEAGTTYELPYLGKYSYENAVASPNANNTTIVVGLDDATPGQVYVYVGNKSDTGNEIQKAGLSGGKLYGIAVSGLLTEVNTGVPAANTPFTLADLGHVANVSGAALNTKSDSAGVTKFLRPEDGAWDPKSPNDFYFVTTNGFSANSRLWKASFTNIATPELGGTITAVLEGSEGQKMLDNIGFDNYGHILMQEDVGGQVHLGKTWQYTVMSDELKLIASHDSTRFLPGASRFLTIDEEASGIIDAEEILGPGMFLFVDQAHYSIPGELAEGGQILAMFNPDTYAASELVSGFAETSGAEELSEVRLYPNPAGNSATIAINLAMADNVVITIIDANGNPVGTTIEKSLGRGLNQVTMNTSDLENGLYIVKVSTSTKTSRIKTVIMH